VLVFESDPGFFARPHPDVTSAVGTVIWRRFSHSGWGHFSGIPAAADRLEGRKLTGIGAVVRYVADRRNGSQRFETDVGADR